MGHDSENLLHADGLEAYSGAILSPVNYQKDRVVGQIARAREEGNFEAIFDPQLYVPNTERGCLREWDYFPNDVDTADLSSDVWWEDLNLMLAATCTEIGPSAVCSPAVLPNTYENDYYLRQVSIASNLSTLLQGTQIATILTVVVSLTDLATAGRALAIASILTRSECDRAYVLFFGTTHPRRELSQTEELKGAMRLIAALQENGVSVLVGYCSSELVLWKFAGATSCATGKFFNLRRFTRARFEEPPEGGGQLAYWFEESLMSFLRESDLIRVTQRGILSESSRRNPFGRQIIDQIRTSPGTAWVGLGWRQFMYWFSEVERRIGEEGLDVGTLLRDAELAWRTLEDVHPPVLMEDFRSDGAWVRSWRRALIEYPTF